jgi:hypothetical protein
MRILLADILHSWVPISEVGSKHPHKSMVRDRVSPSLVVNLHSPPHWRRWHIIFSSFVMWWRRGLLSSISIIFLIVFNEDELGFFFKLRLWLRRDWCLDWCFRGLLLFLGCFLLWLFRCKQGTGWVVASSGDTGSFVCTNHLQSF